MAWKPEMVEERFWLKVDRTPIGCWNWTGILNNKGYGKHGNQGLPAHRSAWRFANGPIPEGLCILHQCDNPRCVRPSHLFLGTYKENTADMTRKGRHGGRFKPGLDSRRPSRELLQAAGRKGARVRWKGYEK